MITLPASPVPRLAVPMLMDFGALLRGPTGGAALRINRAGSRWKWDFEFPPMRPATFRTFAPLVAAGKEQVLRLPVPLAGVSQGTPGSTVVDGAGQTGTTLDVRGGTAAYVARTGYWLHVVDADGNRYLHVLTADTILNGSGAGALSIFPALRAPLADGAAVELAAPTVEGFVVSDVSWELATSGLRVLSFSIEEAA